MFKRLYLTITALVCATAAFSQSGAIKVHMIDKATKQPIPFANVVVERRGQQMGVGTTDIDGYAVVKPLDPGEYDVKAVYEGYQELELTGVAVSADHTEYRELPMETKSVTITAVHIVKDRVPLVDPQTKTGQTVTKEDYQRMAVKDINSVAQGTAGVYSSDVGGALNFRGARNDATQYIVDGRKITNDQTNNGDGVPGGIPQSMIDQITTITGGIPAKYGDVTGGIVEINTISASPKWFGSVSGITSEVMDGFGYNDVNFSVGGPIWMKKDKSDTTGKTKKPVIDFILGGEFSYEKDSRPSFVGGYTCNQSTLDSVEKTPFRINPLGGYLRSTEFVTANQIDHNAYMPNTGQTTISVNGKLGWQVNNNVRVVVGGTYEHDLTHMYTQVYELFNSVNNPIRNFNSWSGFVRLTQRFPTPESKEKSSIIKNAFYTIQGEYGNTYQIVESDRFKENYFDYGYIGKFNQYYNDLYSPTPVNGPKGLAYYMTTATNDSLYTFTPGTLNPLGVNYTTELYNLIGQQNITNSSLLLENGAMLNGSRPNNVYSLWYNTGRTYGGVEKQNSNHLRFTANFSADIKNHAVQIGFEYEQNVLSNWNIGTIDLWNVMRQNVNLQIAQLDFSNPILVSYGSFNTYKYNFAYNPAVQTQIDKSIRQKLGLAANSQVYIQPDNMDPSFFNLNMFSASDLINNGSQVVSYTGYNYLGTGFNNNSSIDDFFNHVDANGNHDYPIAPYHPIYMAAYIQDHFDYKSLKFDVGLRFDRFDANQPVLKDPYLFFPAKTVSELGSTSFAGEAPSNMGSNYVVYVNNSQSPTAIVGYRNGNTWYDSHGNAVSDPGVLTSATTNGSIQPYLENPSQLTINSNAFTTYTPQINVMPRLAFSFPISDVATFFAHYDILTQRPSASLGGANTLFGVNYNIFNPLDYMYIQNRVGQSIANPDLKPQQTIDYELGFQQVLNEQKTIALTISAFYREVRNQIQAYQYLDAYPSTYLTYSNIDFGTVKGLSVAFDLRRVNNIKFRASYTLQFANGTGSGPTSGINLANSGQPNLQIPQTLDYDQRHTFLLNLDYHYASGDEYNGPVWTTKGKKSIQILANAGFNINFNAGSGTPYTRYANAIEGGNVPIGIQQKYTIVGSLNGSYKPWTYRVDARIDKDFPVTFFKSKGDKAKHCDVLVYLAATNLFNTQNVLSVYQYTGSGTDDGYLSSLNGQAAILAATSPQAFQDQYKIKVQDPTYLAMPRQMRLGVIFNF